MNDSNTTPSTETVSSGSINTLDNKQANPNFSIQFPISLVVLCGCLLLLSFISQLKFLKRKQEV